MLTGVQLPRCTAELGPELTRLGHRQIVIPVSGVDQLARTVRGETADIGDVDHRDFYGHLTIARTKPRAPSTIIGTPFESTFEVGEIALVASDLLPTGAVYTTVATFPTSD